MNLHRKSVIFLVISLVNGFSLVAAESLAILPNEIRLRGPEARQTVLAEMADGPLVTQSIRSGMVWTSGDERIAKVVDGQVVPVGNGTTTISVTANGQTATTKVVVEQFGELHQWNFRNHVQ